jgi:hypothetical protein
MRARTILMLLAILGMLAYLIFGPRRLFFGPEARTAAVRAPAEPAPTHATPGLTQTTYAVGRRVRITDRSGRSVPELVAVATDLHLPYTLTGELREHARRDDGANVKSQGLYVVRLDLQVRITERDDIPTVFDIGARGVGIDIDSARRQALRKLTIALRERLEQVEANQR